MCGIFGLMNATGVALEESRVERALASIAHRGPDGSGIWRRSGAGPAVLLGHRRLAIIDLTEAGAQPMVSRRGGQVIVFNGEIYNYRELRDRLVGLGHEFGSDSDTEVLLVAYSEWGDACVDHFNGMFAFAIWDERRQRLFAARDRFGEKPFFFHLSVSGTTLAFSSEIKALLAARVVQFAIDEEALLRYVTDDVIDGAVPTLIAGVSRLLAGQRLRAEWQNGRWAVSTETYWALQQSRIDVGLNAAAEKFRYLLEDSVRLRLRADVPVGTSLSGGLDSSSIVCLIKRLGADSGQRTFSARMPDPKLDEGRFIRAVLDVVDVDAHEVTPTAARLAGCFEKLCWHMEEPFPATSMFAQYLVMELARTNRTTVLLDGQGADELLGGYLHYYRVQMRWLLRSGRLCQFRDELRAFADRRGGQRVLGLKGILACLLPDRLSDRLQARARAPGFASWWNPDWLIPDRVGGVRGVEADSRSSLDALLRHDALEGPLQSLLRYGDRNSMAWSREVRQPFLDHRLAEFAFTLPPKFKIGDGATKRVLRLAMRGVVPDAIVDRHDKLGYQAPLGEWLGGELRDWAAHKLESTREFLSGRLHSGIVDRFLSLSTGMNDWREGREVMRLITLGETLRQLEQIQPAVSATSEKPEIGVA